VTLPRSLRHPRGKGQYFEIGKSSTPTYDKERFMNILIAEDAPVIQMIHEATMEKWGYEYDMASNGAEAVSLARKNNGRYDLCIMDVSMPIMSGIEATRIIRKEVSYFPILGYSSDGKTANTCLESGMDEFLLKPCYPDRLFGIIEELTTKPILVNVENGDISILRAMPMNPDELKELRELKKKGLTKLKLVGLDHSFVVHKNIQNKISHDLIGEGKEISEFIDRSSAEPGRCHLYKVNLHVTKDLFLPDQLEEAIRREDEIAVKFNHITDKRVLDE
jgi:CheY-like chemotaxis protein